MKKQTNGKEPKLSGYFAAQTGLTLWIVVFGLLTNVLIIWIPTVQGELIDRVLSAARERAIVTGILFYVGLVAAVQFFRFFKRNLVRKLENRTVWSMRETIYSNMMNSGIGRIREESVGSLMNKIIGDVGVCGEGLRKIITEIFDTGVMLIGYLIIMLIYDVKLTLLSCALIPVAILIAKALETTVSQRNAVYREENGKVNELAYQNIRQAILFRLNGLQEAYNEEYKKALVPLRKKAVRASFFDTSVEPLYNIVSLSGIILCIYLGSVNVESGTWSVGRFSSFLVMFTAVARKSSRISYYLNLWQKTAVSWRRLKPHLQEQPPEDSSPLNLEGKFSLAFDRVSFRYPGQGQDLIHDLSFAAEAGEIIGICGPIASGKSTLLRLLTVEDGYKGAIRVNGQDLSRMTASQRAQFLSYKGHNPELLSATIRENVALGETLDVREVLTHVCLDEDIKQMRLGLETPIGVNGVILSGGQQDRLALARALAEQKVLIMLDDPFSALDMNTEVKIIQSLRARYAQSLLLITSHRFALFPHIDRILVLDGKGGWQMGSHKELLATNAAYREIYEMQESAV